MREKKRFHFMLYDSRTHVAYYYKSNQFSVDVETDVNPRVVDGRLGTVDITLRLYDVKTREFRKKRRKKNA